MHITLESNYNWFYINHYKLSYEKKNIEYKINMQKLRKNIVMFPSEYSNKYLAYFHGYVLF